MECPADVGHRSIWIAIPRAACPRIKLVGKICRALPGQWRVARIPAAIVAVATGAGCDAPLRNAVVIDPRTTAIIRAGLSHWRGGRQRRVIGSDFLPGADVKFAGNPSHLRMPPRPVGEMLKLACGITTIQPGKPWGKVTITFAAGAMTGGAGSFGTGRTAAESDQFSAPLEWVGGDGRCSARRQREDRENRRSPFHISSQSLARHGGSPRFGLALAIALAAVTVACKPPPKSRYDRDAAAVARGREIVSQSGCGACHAFPDIDWPKGRAGPSLITFDEHGLIAGVLPNTPAQLAVFVRNAPAVKRGSPMPAMPLSQREASDVAAYLYGLADD